MTRSMIVHSFSTLRVSLFNKYAYANRQDNIAYANRAKTNDEFNMFVAADAAPPRLGLSTRP